MKNGLLKVSASIKVKTDDFTGMLCCEIGITYRVDALNNNHILDTHILSF